MAERDTYKKEGHKKEQKEEEGHLKPEIDIHWGNAQAKECLGPAEAGWG